MLGPEKVIGPPPAPVAPWLPLEETGTVSPGRRKWKWVVLMDCVVPGQAGSVRPSSPSLAGGKGAGSPAQPAANPVLKCPSPPRPGHRAEVLAPDSLHTTVGGRWLRRTKEKTKGAQIPTSCKATTGEAPGTPSSPRTPRLTGGASGLRRSARETRPHSDPRVPPSAGAQADQLHGVKGRALPEDTTRGVGGGQPGPREQRVVAPAWGGGGEQSPGGASPLGSAHLLVLPGAPR